MLFLPFYEELQTMKVLLVEDLVSQNLIWTPTRATLRQLHLQRVISGKLQRMALILLTWKTKVLTPKHFAGGHVDGVSLTHGSPREHVWTFAAALGENTSPHSSCLCIRSDATCPPSFIGRDYFCDTGIKIYDPNYDHGFLGDDPLWDGEGCEPPNDCCSFNAPPKTFTTAHHWQYWDEGVQHNGKPVLFIAHVCMAMCRESI